MSARVDRHYVTIGDRQQHYRRCGHGPPVVLLHESPRSSAALLPLVEKLADQFTVFALDTPGYGGSDPLPLARPEIEDYADALAATFGALGIGRAPVYGTHTGALVAFEFARRHSGLCAAAVLDGFPIFTPNEREQFLASYLPPFRPEAQGAHLAWLWSRVRDQFRFFPWNYRGDDARLGIPFPPAERLNLVALDFLSAGDGYRTGYAAAFRHDTTAALAALEVPIIVAAREDDLLFSHIERMPPLPAGSRIARLTSDRAAWATALEEIFASIPGQTAAPPLAAMRMLAGRVTKLFQHTSAGTAFVRAMTGGTKRPLVLLHHSPGASSDFSDVMLRLGHKRPVYAIDLPGNGYSDGLGGRAALADYASAVSLTLERLGVSDTELAGDGTGSAVALAMSHADPARYSNITVTNLPIAGSALPPSFAPQDYGEHLIRAWHAVRDDVIHGPWCSRPKGQAHRFGSELDVEGVHRRVVDALMSENHLDLCNAALAAPLDHMAGHATVLAGTMPLASRIATRSVELKQ